MMLSENTALRNTKPSESPCLYTHTHTHTHTHSFLNSFFKKNFKPVLRKEGGLFVLLITLLLSSSGMCQGGWIGNTKQYILDEKKDWNIIKDKPDTLIYEVNGLAKVYLFDTETSLCKMFINELNEENIKLLTETLPMIGYVTTNSLVFIKGDLVCKIVYNKRGNPTAINFSLDGIGE